MKEIKDTKLPRTREQALSLNQPSYFTGKSCKNGHIDKRYANTGICYQCKRDQIKRDYANHTERVILTNAKSNTKNRNKRNETSKRWVKQNQEKRKKISSKYRKNNREYIRKQALQYQKEIRKIPHKRLSKNISKAIWQCLKHQNKSKQNNSYLSLVNWTLEELFIHLESKFRDGMTWGNYGSHWHLDHIKPLSLFNSTNIMEAWEIKNLQPLLVFENLSKSNKYISYQEDE